MKQETLDSAQLLAEQDMARLNTEIAALERIDPLDEALLLSLYHKLARRVRQWNALESRVFVTALGSESDE